MGKVGRQAVSFDRILGPRGFRVISYISVHSRKPILQRAAFTISYILRYTYMIYNDNSFLNSVQSSMIE